MKKQLTILFLLLLSVIYGQIPAGYYDAAQGLSGYQLKTALKNIITNGHNPHSYGDLYNAYETTDTDHYYENDGTVLDMYSENPTGADPYNYNHHQNTCGTYHDEGDCYNREHLVPQSWFASAMPMKSDAHHVVPADGKVNGMRGHLPLADVGTADWISDNGSKRGICADAGYNGTVFEPIDEFKGDIARIYFYMATRYENEIGSWEDANNDGSDPVLDGTNDHVFEDWYLDVLIQWHNQDPVSQREIDRNNAVYNFQGNRNPFIDHPEWVSAIWDPDSSVQTTTKSINIEIFPVPVQSGQEKLHLFFQNLIIKNIQLYDVTGQRIKAEYVRNQKYLIIGQLREGVYFVDIETDKGNLLKSFIIE